MFLKRKPMLCSDDERKSSYNFVTMFIHRIETSCVCNNHVTRVIWSQQDARTQECIVSLGVKIHVQIGNMISGLIEMMRYPSFAQRNYPLDHSGLHLFRSVSWSIMHSIALLCWAILRFKTRAGREYTIEFDRSMV